MGINENLPKVYKKDELEEKFRKMHAGDEQARNEIVEHNLRLVTHIANKFSTSKDELDDLISIGTIGLIKGVNTFDINKGTYFSTYASRCIENEILIYLKSNNKRKKDISLSTPINNDKNGNELKIEDVLEDPTQDYISEYETKEIIEKLRELIEYIPERDKFIIMKYYGFINDEKITQKEIAEELGYNSYTIGRIIRRNLKCLEREFKKQGIKRGTHGGITAETSPNKVLSKKRDS